MCLQLQKLKTSFCVTVPAGLRSYQRVNAYIPIPLKHPPHLFTSFLWLLLYPMLEDPPLVGGSLISPSFLLLLALSAAYSFLRRFFFHSSFSHMVYYIPLSPQQAGTQQVTADFTQRLLISCYCFLSESAGKIKSRGQRKDYRNLCTHGYKLSAQWDLWWTDNQFYLLHKYVHFFYLNR